MNILQKYTINIRCFFNIYNENSISHKNSRSPVPLTCRSGGLKNKFGILSCNFFHLSVLLIACFIPAQGQEKNITVNTDWDHERHTWEASWISHPTTSPFDYSVILFRNSFEISQPPDSQIIWVSADNRYRLFVNGIEIATGPARGSLQYWRYETLNIAPFLKQGKNVIAAEIFNLGEYKPVAQLSYQTAFILQASGFLGTVLNTGKPGWSVTENNAYHSIPINSEFMGKFYVAGPCDSITGKDYPWNWELQTYNDFGWERPRIISKGAGRGYMHGIPWHLVPRNIPPMEITHEPIQNLIRVNQKEVNSVFPGGKNGFSIDPGTKITLLLDQKQLTMGYPEMITEGGTDSKIKIIYSEALYSPDGSKGNRNEISGKSIKGYYDVFMPGGTRNHFRTLWIRTFRFIQLEIETGADTLVINSYHNKAVRYPFAANSSFDCNDPSITQILNTGWNTARMCALETYMDCPYWEQLQYIGDTRIQALISLYNSGDNRLMKNAILLADQSRIPEGLTLGRAPSATIQVTPTFSLIWIWMIHDYYMHASDTEFLRQFLPGISSVLDWFGNKMAENGLLGGLDWFNFTDWTRGFKVGVPEGADTGGSALISLNYSYALQKAAEIYSYFGITEKSVDCKEKAAVINRAVHSLCWNKEKGLYSDTPGSGTFSQHTNIFAILTGAAPPDNFDNIMEKILADSGLIQTTVYYKFYLFEALKKTSLSDQYINLLFPWKEMIQKGLTTFEEGDYDERSDCHAWSASPCYHIYSLVCGINPDSVGFRSVVIKPNPGSLDYLSASCIHPRGKIEMELMKTATGKYLIVIDLPESLSGKLVWKKESFPLKPGHQRFEL